MARNRYAAKPPLYGMVLVFCAIVTVAATAYLHTGWWSLLGYAVAAVAAIAGATMVFRDPS
ncbi:hypothetical protein MU0083_000279 [[Mycobacterium] kokjensenii]|uniref:Transmembrane protein n=1 Tax=[Mycobacterium] kokjensenii TaxID=3064287 RepID=A0ABM9L6N5_9MYCO|nr:hypothetical protein [Mycolicibacter sp. MU0083]CAJ1493361.1 hypothetical protein MU0083_000279 [Mycolicibacter sp. MU0083]